MTTPDQFAVVTQWRAMVVARFDEPQTQPVSTVASINTDYPATDWPNATMVVSDGTSGKLVVSVGGIWEYMDGTPV